MSTREHAIEHILIPSIVAVVCGVLALAAIVVWPPRTTPKNTFRPRYLNASSPRPCLFAQPTPPIPLRRRLFHRGTGWDSSWIAMGRS